MSKFIVEIPDDVVEEYDTLVDVMDEIAEALADQFGADKITVKEVPWP